MDNLPWFRFYGSEFLSDPKMDHLDGNERSIWITLLCFASQNSGVAKSISEKLLIDRSGIKVGRKRYVGVLDKFIGLCMVEVSNGNVTICNWSKRQYSESYSRVLEYRKRKGNAIVTSYTDTESDTDKRNTKESFEKFWNSYPKKVARKKAEQIFSKIPPSEYDPILRHVKTARESEQWKVAGGQYIPHPATYLNQERWKDQVEIPATAPPNKKCPICGLEKSYWVESGGGMCGDCFTKPVPNKKLSNLKASLVEKSTLKP